MVQMTAAINEVSSAAREAATSGSATQSAAGQGHVIVVETMEAIQRAALTTSEAADHIKKLGENSESIGAVVNVIEDIANQTNLLALNAAIESARAGELGRGFAVVAGEVRRLAERTTQATKEIAAIISSVQSETTKAVSSVERGRSDVEAGLACASKCSTALDEIVKLAQHSEERTMHIAMSAEQQTSAAAQVSRSMNSVSDFTHHATAASEETVTACNGLARTVTELEHQLQAFIMGEQCG
jgi:methyl-accepting chemotaxis protein